MKMLTRSFFPFATVVFLSVAAMRPASAASITITSVTDPEGNPLVSSGMSSDGLTWSGAGASVFNTNPLDLGFYGTFTCAVTCSDQFTVNFFTSGLTAGSTAYGSLFGSTTTANDFVDLQALSFSSNGSLANVFSNSSTSFNLTSTPIGISAGLNGSTYDFTGAMFITLNMQGGTVNLPAAATADLIINPGSSAVPEPATIAILAACLLLLIYVKRLRRA